MKSGSIEAGPEAFQSYIKVEEVGTSTSSGHKPLTVGGWAQARDQPVYENFDIQAGMSEFKSPYRAAPTPVSISGSTIFDLPLTIRSGSRQIIPPCDSLFSPSTASNVKSSLSYAPQKRSRYTGICHICADKENPKTCKSEPSSFRHRFQQIFCVSFNIPACAERRQSSDHRKFLHTTNFYHIHPNIDADTFLTLRKEEVGGTSGIFFNAECIIYFSLPVNFLGLVFNDTDVWYMRKRVNFTPLIQWKRGARHATRADCLGEVRNHRTIYGNWRGSRATVTGLVVDCTTFFDIQKLRRLQRARMD
ncbi:uncharacterized protein LACBIDRAFT_330237 [Laccaria bicolor S238N-H82]|uniref:Predicted protein n=1 Tax=Laccaria bicolor (strain S238N-H82 / ATCC MYA-4686) TaxID=486041 RepID=B0DKN4_LACBS|nr:uncharacterized protein LACBIDRAFT_330237 [Laccaria bicolor S238N-H82]EDR04772.1 predicted protein [Laccaria bicolor S238N-H82]|eukprot:XP_001884596.1 predicted protein [Laccaria bicolor S238N-H82]